MIGSRLAAAVAALLMSAATPALETLRLEATRNNGVFLLDAEVHIEAPISAVRAIVTDYEQLERLSDRIEESSVLEREPNGTLVFTRVNACFAFFCRTLERVERVIEYGPYHIEATTLPERSNVKQGKIVWMLHEAGEGTRMEYHLTLEPGFWVPPLIGRIVIPRSMRAEAVLMFERIEELAGGAADGG